MKLKYDERGSLCFIASGKRKVFSAGLEIVLRNFFFEKLQLQEKTWGKTNNFELDILYFKKKCDMLKVPHIY